MGGGKQCYKCRDMYIPINLKEDEIRLGGALPPPQEAQFTPLSLGMGGSMALEEVETFEYFAVLR